MSKTKMNKAIKKAKQETEEKISTEFSNGTDKDNIAFYDFITNQSGQEDKEQIKIFTDVFASLKQFNDKKLTTITPDKVINDLYNEGEKTLINKANELKHNEYEQPIKSYLNILKDLTKTIQDIKQANNTVETTIYICEGEKDCTKYDPEKDLPEIFTACALQVTKNKTPTIHCKRKRSIKESQKQKGFFGMFGGSKTKTRRRHKNKSRRR